jgi:hypothetical protein
MKKNGIGGSSSQLQQSQHVHVERFGSYRCDSTWQLVVSAVQAMKAITGEDIEFLLWTGYVCNSLCVTCFRYLLVLISVMKYVSSGQR